MARCTVLQMPMDSAHWELNTKQTREEKKNTQNTITICKSNSNLADELALECTQDDNAMHIKLGAKLIAMISTTQI